MSQPFSISANPGVNPPGINPDTPGQEASGYSRYVQRVRRRYASEMCCLADGQPVRALMEATFQTLKGKGMDTGAALRVLRQLVMERLVVLDCDGGQTSQAPLAVVTRAMTELAELALDAAMVDSQKMLDASYGVPQCAESAGGDTRARMWVVGMGKLGGRELNVSSDIDLIYVYDHDGETSGLPNGRGRISNHEYFAHQVKALYSLIGDTT